MAATGTHIRQTQVQCYRANGTVTVNNNTTVVNILGANTAVAIQAGTTYRFKLWWQHNSTGTTSHTERLTFALGGSASLLDILYGCVRFPRVTSGTNIPPVWGTSASATVISGTITTASDNFYMVEGTFRVNAGGTICPQFGYSAGPGGSGTIGAGAYMEIIPLGPSSANIEIGSWT